MISIVIPTFNEGARIGKSVEEVHSFLSERSVEHEIILADNGSTDNTLEESRRLADQHAWCRQISLPKRGPGNAFKAAVAIAQYDWVATIDADLSSSLHFLEDAGRLFDSSDLVIGSKTLGSQRRTLIRLLGSHTYIAFVQWLFDLAISDYSIGSKAFRRSKIVGVLDSLDPWTGYVLEICLYAKINRLKTVEIPVDCEDHYKSSFNLLYEGYYRYRHLFRLRRMLAQNSSWLRQSIDNPGITIPGSEVS